MSVDPNLPLRIFRYDHKVTWTIINFDFHQDHVQTITSPEFDVRCLNVTTWSFQLYPKTNRDYIEFSVRLHYNADSDIGEVPITSVEFAIYLIDAKEGKCFHAEGCFCPNSSEPTSTPIEFIPLKDFQDWRHLRNGSFVVVCELTSWFNHHEFTSSVYTKQLVSLSNCVRGMMDLPNRCDVFAFSREKKEFKVHRCILQARCPKIFCNSLDLVQKVCCPYLLWYSSISTDGLRILLSYLYGEIKIEVPDHVKLELMSVATRYQLKDLERNLREYPLDLALETEIVVQDITVKLPLNDEIWDSKNGEHFYQVQFKPTKKLSVPLLKVSFSSDGTNFEIGFSMDLVGKVPILFRCFLCTQDKDNKVLQDEKYCHLFTDNTPYSVTPPFLTKTVYEESRPRVLVCNVWLSEGSFQDRYSPNQNPIIIPGRCILINNLLALSRDLRFMYENRLNCDLKIVVGEYHFFGHKCFLEERSSKIERSLAFGERVLDDGMVMLKFDTISPHIFRIALQYMYCGTIDACDIETAKGLKKAADYFCLPLLEVAGLAEEWLSLRPVIKQNPYSNIGSDVVISNDSESTLNSTSRSNNVAENGHRVITLADVNQFFKNFGTDFT